MNDKKAKRFPLWVAPTAAALAVALILGVALWPKAPAAPGANPVRPGTAPALARTLALAEYPEMAQYPKNPNIESAYNKWSQGRRALRSDADQRRAYAESLQGFLTATAREFLTGKGSENAVYSPLSVYMALSMLAEITDGDSQAQILTLLNVADMEALRTQTRTIWEANYCDDGVLTSILGSSLWLRNDMGYNEETVSRLAEVYYASVFQGEMGSEELNEALHNWLNSQTGGLLQDEAGSIKLDPDTILALATTVYFEGRWGSTFGKEQTDKQVFHAPGGDVETDFMHRTDPSGTYYWGDNFGAVHKGFESGGSMWFLLPDEGVDVETLASDPEALALLTSWRNGWDNVKNLKLHLSIPKFDVAEKSELVDGLKALGVTDVFDGERSDFSPVTDFSPVWVEKVTHAARVMVDEDGVKAAAFTVVADTGAGMPPDEEIDFVLDRPFLFAIEGLDGLPLFIGIVNQP